jgi:uncharacterized protein (DUF2461 family)
MLQKSTLAFLKALKKNKNRDWFEKNREKYEAAREDFSTFVNKLIAELSKQDASLKGVTAKDPYSEFIVMCASQKTKTLTKQISVQLFAKADVNRTERVFIYRLNREILSLPEENGCHQQNI